MTTYYYLAEIFCLHCGADLGTLRLKAPDQLVYMQPCSKCHGRPMVRDITRFIDYSADVADWSWSHRRGRPPKWLQEQDRLEEREEQRKEAALELQRYQD